MIKKSEFLSLIRQGSFRELFVSELGWNRYRGQESLPTIVVDNVDYNISAVAERSGFQILYCEVDNIPTQSIAKKIDTKLRRQAADYICIFRLRGGNAHDLWVVPVRSNEKRDLVLVEYEDAKAELLYSKIDGITFAFDEVSNIVDLRNKVQGAFAVNSEKITKDFYSGFKKEHKAFSDFITGIDDHVATKDNRNKQWYASVMLNRLMFCYFIQKKGFLNLDHDYLRNKLNWVRQEKGEGRFFKSFYQGFLTSLFHDGLNSPRHDSDFERLYGKIPYLNGGMFDDHQIEREYSGIDIDDEAFIRLFNFFDTWRWHLDTRLTASGRDINPDVLGYIFEQYINDRAQMGAYYTKEDITEYIGRNCILPFLFDEVKRSSDDNGGYFEPDGFVWSTLRNSGDRYIFDAVKKGYTDFNSIPENISRGIITEEMRKEYAETPVGDLPSGHIPLAELRADWNSKTPERWGLPAEIWRETIERLSRCRDILSKIKNGEITSINDFITYNLDIRNFATDLLANADNRFVGRFYHALQKVTILDPTCGSGAFLFAAMNILEPLYEICIERMQEFNASNPLLFKKEIAEISNKYRSNIQYFIFKSIILRNLYGVDIMMEATEIAKLRLFLKMVAVVDVDRRSQNLGLDPLPDIDFNIRCGNTLVGYANKEDLDLDLSTATDILQVIANDEFKEKIDEEMKKVARTYSIFKSLQLNQEEDMAAFKQAKHDLHERLEVLNEQLNLRLHSATSSEPIGEWLKSHQPFHWLAEFYQIIAPASDGGNGGFDVIIGNPPYVVYTKKDKESNLSIADKYKLCNYLSIKSNNLYAFVLERSLSLVNSCKRIGMIIPLSYGAAANHSKIREIISNGTINYISSFEIRPAKLFDGVKGADQRLNIVLVHASKINSLKSTRILRWHSEHRCYLFPSIYYTDSFISNRIWRISSELENSIFNKYNKFPQTSCFTSTSGAKVHYRSAGLRYWILFLYNGFNTESTSNRAFFVKDLNTAKCAMSILNSSLYWWYYALNFDMFNQTENNILSFKVPGFDNSTLSQLAEDLELSLDSNKEDLITTKNTGEINKSYAYNKKLSKPIIDEIDRELAKHYGFTEEELDFIINYDIKYRMGDELNNSDD